MTTLIPQPITKNASATATAKARIAKRRPQAARSKANHAGKATAAKKPDPARPGTKTAKILDLLRRPVGASIKDLMKATGWQAHSVRGFLSGTLKKKMGLKVDSFLRANDERAYRLAK